ncbi:MAG: oligosaccharide flippase family protein [Bryobacteraceae bacterium]|nr:oligosaccharide flippase family protein [Bryobacteraceae bacterium]
MSAAAAADPSSAGSLGRKVFKTTIAQILGRNFISLGRLALASLVVRQFGMDVFGQYSVILVLLAIAEWLVDFGTNDVVVRDVCQKPGEESTLFRVMTAVKAVQAPAAFAVFAVLLVVLRYPGTVVEAALIGGASLFLFAGILCYRVVFRAALMLEREILAEMISLAVMGALVFAASRRGLGLSAIFAAYVVARAVFLSIAWLLGRGRYQPSVRGVQWRDIGASLKTSSAIGLIGLIVVSYETLDILILSRLSAISEVANYSGAQRFVLPVLTSLSAVGSTLFPIVSMYWPNSREKFEEAFQRGLEAVLFLAGCAVCLLLSGSAFLVSILSPSLTLAPYAIQILAVVCFAKAVSTAASPVLYAVHREKEALKFMSVAITVKVLLLVVLAPRYGCMGTAFAVLAADSCFAVISILMAQRYSGYRLRWGVPISLILIGIIAGVAPVLLSLRGPLAMALAFPLYCGIVLGTGTVRLAEMRALVERKKPA